MENLLFNISKCKILHVGHNNPKYEYFINGIKLSWGQNREGYWSKIVIWLKTLNNGKLWRHLYLWSDKKRCGVPSPWRMFPPPPPIFKHKFYNLLLTIALETIINKSSILFLSLETRFSLNLLKKECINQAKNIYVVLLSFPVKKCKSIKGFISYDRIYKQTNTQTKVTTSCI